MEGYVLISVMVPKSVLMEYVKMNAQLSKILWEEYVVMQVKSMMMVNVLMIVEQRKKMKKEFVGVSIISEIKYRVMSSLNSSNSLVNHF